MVNPIPEKVKECLSELTAAQQVTIRGYIGTLRAEMKELEEQLRAVQDPDPHAHFHGHEKCTADHGHKDQDHQEGHHEKHHDDGHKHEHHEHKHGHHDDKDKHHDHEHGHDEHHHEDHNHKEEHEPEHEHDHHEHDHEHEHHEHKHDHAKEAEEIPAWKRRALESGTAVDPMAAPFGGDWKSESMANATEDKMEE